MERVHDWSMEELFATDFFIHHRILTDGEVLLAHKRLEELYQWEFTPRLNHGNLAPKNTIVSNDGTVFLLDWGTASAHRAPHLELSDVLAWGRPEHFVQSFFRGYGLTEEDFKGMRYDIDTLILLRFLDSIKWAAERKTRWEEVDFVIYCRQQLPRFIGRLS